MSQKTDISSLRVHYTINELLEDNILPNPFGQFEVWFEEALEGGILEPNAMILSTAQNNQPKSRIVLLKALDSTGFVFYTNYASHKGQQLAENPFAAISFFWDKMQRQVNIEGVIEKVSGEESDEYFWSRPRGSQIGAWVSNQSEVIESREIIETKLIDFEKKFEGIEFIPRPPHWGGYRLIPSKIEFWQGRPNRLHDRLVYTKAADGSWKIDRLSP